VPAFPGDTGVGFAPGSLSEPAPAPAERRAARHEKKKRTRGGREDSRRTGGSWRWSWWVVPTVVVSALLWVLLGPAVQLGQAAFVSYNGVPLQVTSGVTLDQAREAQGAQAPHEGAQLDVAGDVRSIAGGAPAVVRVADATVTPQYVLVDGARVVEQRGQDVGEKLVKTATDIPFETTVEGKGWVVTMVTKGAPGVNEKVSGASSKRVVAEYVAKAPVDALIRKTKTGGSRVVALTFDDGPDQWTAAILAVLAARDIPATFFVLGGNVSSESQIQRLRDAGHEVGNHTWGHPNLTTLSAEQVRREIERTDDVIGGSTYFRPPGGNYNSMVAAQVGALGKQLILWNVDTRDWENRNADAILAHVKAETRPGSIILMHDGGGDRSATVAALPRVIDWLISQGYGFATLEDVTGG
jgi:peptidoglycan/xylan/chitin deacetylase (PgdA/CDA1 family)